MMFLDEARISLKAFLSAEGLITRDRHTRRVAGAGPQFGLGLNSSYSPYHAPSSRRHFIEKS